MLSPSARIIQNLPEEILEEILLRLPVRSLLILKCVCKSWYSLISTKHFIEAHHKACKEDTSLDRWSVIWNKWWPSESSNNGRQCAIRQYSLRSILSGAIDEATEDGVSENDGPYIVGCCNGIICFFTSSSRCFTLWNPSTGKLRKLPDLNEEHFWYVTLMNGYGFGFDEITEDYKVVVIRNLSKTWLTLIPIMNIYSLKSNSWKQIEMLEIHIPLNRSGKYLKNKLHWQNPRHGICSFDLVSEVWEMLEVPNFYDSKFFHVRSVGVLWGCVSVVCVGDSPATGRDIWVWVINKEEKEKEKEKQGSWTRLLTIEYLFNVAVPLSVVPRGRLLLFDKWNISIYDAKDNSFHRVKELGDSETIYNAEICIESLVQLE